MMSASIITAEERSAGKEKNWKGEQTDRIVRKN
jgi:hypothetical protein